MNQHIDYPLAPEKLKIDTTEKLVGSFYPKSRYVIHYQNLKEYVSRGLKLTAVHRGIKFKQSTWMSSYITKILNSESLPQTVLGKFFSNWWTTQCLARRLKTCENYKMCFCLTTNNMLSNYHQNQILNESQYLTQIWLLVIWKDWGLF